MNVTLIEAILLAWAVLASAAAHYYRLAAKTASSLLMAAVEDPDLYKRLRERRQHFIAAMRRSNGG